MWRVLRWFVWVLILLLLPAVALGSSKVLVVPIQGAIGPVTQDLVIRGLEQARDEDAALLVLEMNTPGGLDTSMREIIRAILASPVPVATYVYPSGSRAASAGTYILYASHIAAMTPASNLGSATPVAIGGLPRMPGSDPQGASESGADSMEKKVINDAAAYIRGLAVLRGRNVEWAEAAVREAVNLTATEAMEQGVIDVIAANIDDLLAQINGKVIEMDYGQRELMLDDPEVERIEPNWRSELLAVITDPNAALLLMMVGIYGLFIEFSHPGFILPGVLGVISLLLAAYAFQMLPVNYVGLTLVTLGMIFMLAEFFVTSGGILGGGGLVALVIGAVILFDDQYLAVSVPLIGGIALVAGGFLLWMIERLTKLRHTQVVSGMEYMIGRAGEAVSAFDGKGSVHIDGEYWTAHSILPVAAGQAIKVVDANHMVLEVIPEEES